MPWKVLEKIIWRGKKKDSQPSGPENIVINTRDSSLYNVKIKNIKTVTINIKKDE